MENSKSSKQLRKELELEQQQIELEEARAKLEVAKLGLEVERRVHDRTFKYDPMEDGRFYMTGPIDGRSCHYLLGNVDRYAYLHPKAPITIYFETPGGSVLPGLGLYDSLRALGAQGHPITTVVRGYAASLGAVLLQAGDTRLVGPESMFMIHEISSMAMGKLHEMEDDLAFTKKLNKRMFDIIARRTDGKFTGASLYRRAAAKDWWLDADEAVANGFADRIG
jgi:ATP-dependent Clp protease protease subunit